LLRKLEQNGEGVDTLDSSSLKLAESDGKQEKMLFFMASLGKRMKREKPIRYSPTGVKFLRAGFRRGDVIHIFWGARCFLTILFPSAFLLFSVTGSHFLNYQVLLGVTICVALLGFFLPEFWLRLRIASRQKQIAGGFADVLDLLCVCVEAGMGLDSAMSRVAEEIKLNNKAWSEELKYFNLELQAGKSRRGGLKNLAIRAGIEDMKSLATLLIQADQFGTSLGKTLRVYSSTFRVKRYQKAEEMAAKLPVKLVVPLILFIMPAMMIALCGPAAIQVYEFFLSR
jgi:tight adherence protein C